MNETLMARLRAVEEEQRLRRGSERLLSYNAAPPVHEKQLAFHRSRKRNRWVFGGNRSGKTECGAVETVWLARGCHPYRENRRDAAGWVVSLSREVQRDVAQAKVLSYLSPRWIDEIVMCSGRRDSPESGVIDQIRVKNVFGGISVIGFKSCDQGREKFQGASLDFVWFDEEPPREIYEECRMRVLDRRGDLFGTMTPLKGLTFAYEEIYLNPRGDPEIWCEFMEWADNPFLSREETAALAASLPADTLESRRYGRFRAAEGLVYPEFDESVHVVDPFPVPPEWQARLSIDPGLNNPLSCHWYAVDGDDNVYAVAEHYAAGRDLDYHAREIRRISAELGWHTDAKGRIEALIDPAANQRTLSAPASVSELFAERGILVDANVNKNLFAGISRVRSYLAGGDGRPRLYIFRNCVNLIREFKGYWWGENDRPRKREDHALDELRYFLMTRPEGKRAAQEKSEIRKDKERLIRRLTAGRRRE